MMTNYRKLPCIPQLHIHWNKIQNVLEYNVGILVVRIFQMPDCCYIDVLGYLWAGMLVRMGFGLDIQGPLGRVGGSGLPLSEIVHFHNFRDILLVLV